MQDNNYMAPLKKISHRVREGKARVKRPNPTKSILKKIGSWWELKHGKLVQMNWEEGINQTDLVPRTNLEKTLDLRLAHVLFEMDSMVLELEADAQSKLLGPNTKSRFNMLAILLKTRLKALREEITKITYIEVP